MNYADKLNKIERLGYELEWDANGEYVRLRDVADMLGLTLDCATYGQAIATPTPITAEALRATEGWSENSESLGFFFQVVDAGCGKRELTVDPIPQRAAWTFEINGMCICEVQSMEQLAAVMSAIRGPGE